MFKLTNGTATNSKFNGVDFTKGTFKEVIPKVKTFYEKIYDLNN